jgi:hypothetical protein
MFAQSIGTKSNVNAEPKSSRQFAVRFIVVPQKQTSGRAVKITSAPQPAQILRQPNFNAREAFAIFQNPAIVFACLNRGQRENYVGSKRWQPT